MKKVLSSFVATAFLVMQCMAVAHTHAHEDGDEGHDHGDCALCFIINMPNDIPPDGVTLDVLPQPPDRSPIEPQCLVSRECVIYHFSTAPPALV